MTAVKLPGQMEVPLVVVHKPMTMGQQVDGYQLAKLLRSYDESPTSQKWIDIQQLAREILK